MALVKVQHALVSWTEVVNGRLSSELAFRGQIIDIPDEEAQRLLDLDAVVDPDGTLPVQGKLMELPEAATDEEILSWAMSANEAETEQLIASRPILAERVLAAREVVDHRMAQQNEILGGDNQAQQPAPESQPEDPDAAARAGVDPAADPNADPAADPADPNVVTYNFAELVQGNVPSISQYLSEHPEHAAAVMEAENALAAGQDRSPREGVINAVRVAAQHAGSGQ